MRHISDNKQRSLERLDAAIMALNAPRQYVMTAREGLCGTGSLVSDLEAVNDALAEYQNELHRLIGRLYRSNV